VSCPQPLIKEERVTEQKCGTK